MQRNHYHKTDRKLSIEEILDAKGIECDNKIKELPEEKIKEILEEVRKLRDKVKKKKRQQEEQQSEGSSSEGEESLEEEQEVVASS